MASSGKTQHGASANRRHSPSGESRRASSARTPSRSNTPTRPKPAEALALSAARPRYQRLSRRFVVAAVLAALALMIWGFYPVARVQYREERERARLRAELTSLQSRNARLGKQVARLRTPEGVEDLARENLGWGKKGEQVGVVLDSSAGTSTSSASKVPQVDTEQLVTAPRGPWTPVLDMVFGVKE
jgi:cell division protein FtsB